MTDPISEFEHCLQTSIDSYYNSEIVMHFILIREERKELLLKIDGLEKSIKTLKP